MCLPDYSSWTVKLKIMSEDQAKTYRINPFACNIAGGLSHATPSVQKRMLAQFQADPDYAERVRKANKLNSSPTRTLLVYTGFYETHH
jgi:catalase